MQPEGLVITEPEGADTTVLMKPKYFAREPGYTMVGGRLVMEICCLLCGCGSGMGNSGTGQL